VAHEQCRLKLELLGIGTRRIFHFGVLNSYTVVALDDHVSDMN
jgi:hypothetical protein